MMRINQSIQSIKSIEDEKASDWVGGGELDSTSHQKNSSAAAVGRIHSDWSFFFLIPLVRAFLIFEPPMWAANRQPPTQQDSAKRA
jgi:hypothetical protein